jgi:hypothetical protein
MPRAADRFWLWGHEAGTHNGIWNLPGASRISPVEAAYYLGVPNVIMVQYGTSPWPPDAQYILPFKSLREVVWSVVGAGGTHESDQANRVLELPHQLPNMTGVIMDDFFRSAGDELGEGVLAPVQLRTMAKRLSMPDRKLDLWVVLYSHQLDLRLTEHLESCDKVTFWTWEANDLHYLEQSFARMERLLPQRCARLLGCYMWDYGSKRPMPVETMARQCEIGFRWLQEDRIDGIIFLASCICDLELDSVEWTRRWVAEVGEAEIPDPPDLPRPAFDG